MKIEIELTQDQVNVIKDCIADPVSHLKDILEDALSTEIQNLKDKLEGH